MTDPNVVSIRHVSKTFRQGLFHRPVQALCDVSFDIPRGSCFAILGANGAGKSTLLKIILGHLFADRGGQLRILGQDPRAPELRARLGYLPEQTAFWPSLTAREVLLFFGKLHRLSAAQTAERITLLLEMVGLAHAADRTCGTLSHGMRKRLGLAVALIADPDVLILDEPTAGMDPLGCREVKDMLRALVKRGKTILITSHLLADIEDMCDRAALLHAGKVQHVGALQSMLRDEHSLCMQCAVESPADESLVREKISAALADRTFCFEHARESLEDYFVAQIHALSTQEESSGAREGKGLEAFLSALEKPLEKPIEAPEIKPDTAMLEALSPAHDAALQPEENVDHAAIDSLTAKKK